MNSSTSASTPDKLPAWLSALDVDSITRQPLPLRELLEGSLYYPSCGTDGGPVKYMGYRIQSFIYIDYGFDRASFLEALRQRPFFGYRILASRAVRESELQVQGWLEPPLSEREMIRARDATRNLRGMPFCEWLVFERLPEMTEQHGPQRFSMLYLCADGVAAFQALYVEKAIHPAAIAVIQPGYGFGGNWTNFTDPEGPLARVVRSNSAGLPTYLLYGGHGPRRYFTSLPWPQYSELVRWYPYHTHGNVCVRALAN